MSKPCMLAACTVLACCLPLQAAAVRKVTLAVISVADDARYAKRRMELAYPGHPQGRAIQGVELAVQDTALELQDAGVELNVHDLVLPTDAALPQALQQLKAAQVGHIVADLPEPALRELVRTASATLGEVIFNTGLADDGLRGDGCAASLLHTMPSQQMQADALAQFLASAPMAQAAGAAGAASRGPAHGPGLGPGRAAPWPGDAGDPALQAQRRGAGTRHGERAPTHQRRRP